MSKEDFFPNPKSKPSIYGFSWQGRLLILLRSISWSCRLEKQQITLICPWQIRIDTLRKWCVCDGMFVCVKRVCVCVCVYVCKREREREKKRLGKAYSLNSLNSSIANFAWYLPVENSADTIVVLLIGGTWCFLWQGFVNGGGYVTQYIEIQCPPLILITANRISHRLRSDIDSLIVHKQNTKLSS